MATFPNAFFTDSVGASETGFQGTGLQDAENIKGEGCMVSLGPESVVLGTEPDDRHVLACAIQAGAHIIITQNVTDFPPAVLAEWQIQAQSADAFLTGLYSIWPAEMDLIITEQAAALTNPPIRREELLDKLRVHAPGFVQALRAR